MSATNRRIRESTTQRSISPDKQLRRLVLANMLFEDQFYLDGISNYELLKVLVAKADPKVVQNLAIEARTKFKLRHVPLAIARELARTRNLPADVLAEIIQRPDEMGEFVSLYWKDGKQPLSNQVKKGLAKAFHKFNEYQLAKWNKDSAVVKLRDVMFMTHVKPKTPEQEALFKRVAENTLTTPDTWEVALSGGADKAETFIRLMEEKKLGALAFLRNLRNMTQSGIPVSYITEYAKNLDVSKVLPFRFIAAARIVPNPKIVEMLEEMMFRALKSMPKLPGKTVLLVDVSGSMFGFKISGKSDLDRFDAAAALAILCRELCESVEIYSFSATAVRVRNTRGFDLVKAISDSQYHGGTRLGVSMEQVNGLTSYDRVVVFTDEQSSDRPRAPKNDVPGYIVNVAAYKDGINNGSWLAVDGFSEAVFDYIREIEADF